MTSDACTTCPLHNGGQLAQLGVDMTGWDYVVALAGNPNVGKSTVFNAPVSYTHLRAHETVLDLVCRLLLEKKK